MNIFKRLFFKEENNDSGSSHLFYMKKLCPSTIKNYEATCECLARHIVELRSEVIILRKDIQEHCDILTKVQAKLKDYKQKIETQKVEINQLKKKARKGE